MKINLLENDRKVEDIKVNIRFDGWEAERTGCAGVPRHVCLLAVLKLKVNFKKLCR